MSTAAERLRQKLLDLAIRGKLIPQDPNDEPADVLLGKIAAERERQMAQKIIKKEKPLPSIEDNGGLSELPVGWAWCRFLDVIKYLRPDNYIVHSEDYDDSYATPVLTAGQTFILGRTNETDGHYCAAPNRPVIIFDDFTTSTQWVDFEFKVKSSAMKILEAISADLVDLRYLFHAIRNVNYKPSTHARQWIDKFSKFALALPPLAEQKRIVAALDTLMKDVDTVSEGLEKIDDLKDKTRAKILDLAIRGKLVEQDKNDEPAAQLLERIWSKTFTPITDDENPFDLPKGWAWCRGRELFVDTETKLPHGEYFDYVDIDAIDIIASKHLLVSKAPSRASRGVCCGDTLFSIVRPYLENIAFVSEEYKDCIASTGFFVCRSCGAAIPRFAFLLMMSPYVITGLNAFMKGDNSPSIRKGDILNFVYPLPPLAEQHRIVAKVDEMLAACEALTGGVCGS